MIRFQSGMVKRFLLSPKTVVALICAAGIACVIGSLVPQLAQRPPKFFETWSAKNPAMYRVIDLLQLNQVFTSVWFLFLIALVASSLALSNFYQAKALIKSGRNDRKGLTKIPFRDCVTIEAARNRDVEPVKLDGEIKGILKRRGYHFCRETGGSGYLVFVKNRIGRWSSVMFHAGVLVIIAAALYGLAFQKQGFVQLIEADTFAGKGEEWRAKKLGVFADDFNLDFRLALKKFTPSYWDTGKVRNMEDILAITDKKGSRRELPASLQKAVEFEGVKIYQTEYYGYSLRFILERAGRAPAVINLLLDAPAKKNEPFTGRTDLSTTGYTFDMKFYPVSEPSSSYAGNPRLDLVVTEKGEQRFKGTLLLNQRVQFGNEILTFAQTHYWTGVILAAHYGMPAVYFGFALTTLGAIMIFMVSYKEIHVSIAEREGRIQLCMGGRSKSDQAIFSEELRGIAEMLRKMMGVYGNRSIA